ncbi:MAG: T9SS type A sorting domain-containing protein [Bacteroidota bacterium]
MELGDGNDCASTLATNNSAPTVNAGVDYTIPANTPFVLTATGSDPNGDALTYCWEQFDLGPVVAGIPTGNETQAPLFRSLPPTTSPQRFFPNLPDLVSSGGATWEVLPKVARNMTFIVTLRDFGAAGYGCTVQDEMEVDVVSSSGFAVTSPNGGEVWQSGTSVTVTWDEGGTEAGTTVNCANVEIVLSTDGGATFDQVLATVPNNGSASITAPTVTETDARLLIRCADNIFFDVGDADFSIEQTDYSYDVTTGTATACNGGSTAEFGFDLESLQGYTGTINYSWANLPAGASISFSPPSTTLTAGGNQAVTVTLSGLGGLPPGNYTFQIITNDGNGARSEDYTLTVQPPLADPVLTSPVAGGFVDPNAASFSWQAVPNATNYRIDFYQNANGTGALGGLGGLIGTSVNFGSNLSFIENECYYWQITATNTSCTPAETSTSEIRKFVFGTAPPTGSSLSNNSGPIEICEGETTDETFDVTFVNGDLTGPASLSVQSAPNGLTVTIAPMTLDNGQTATVSLDGEETLAPGMYTITIRADDGNNTEDLDLTLTIIENGVPLISPTFNQEIQIQPNGNGTIPLFFDAIPGASSYTANVVFPSGGTAMVGVSPGGTNLGVGAVNDGDQFQIFITTDNGAEGCPVPFTFLDVVLPVEWLTFTASAVGKTSVLNWSVIQDPAHAGFTVERRSEARTDWEDIGRVGRSGPDGNATYQFTDEDVIDGLTYFYRLRQEDRDGSTDYSVIRSITFSGAAQVVAFPNPTDQQLNLSVSSTLPDNLTYRLFSSIGQQLTTGKLPQGRMTLDLAAFPPAVYQIVVTDGGAYRQMIRVVKR